MKNTILLLFLPLFLGACVDEMPTLPDGVDGMYYGDLVVGDYTQKNVGISVTETSDSTVDIFFDNVFERDFVKMLENVDDETINNKLSLLKL